MSTIEVAALFVDRKGPYFDMPGVDPWDVERDATRYAGPHPVVAHPPCAAWCQLAGIREARYGYPRGEDGGVFAAALASVRRWGGVLEHPAFSKAWAAHGLFQPHPCAGWQKTIDGEWVCRVSQAAYGHRARKLTWLLLVGAQPPMGTDWATPRGTGVVSGMRNNSGRPLTERVWPAEAKRTPQPFADFLVAMARSVSLADVRGLS